MEKKLNSRPAKASMLQLTENQNDRLSVSCTQADWLQCHKRGSFHSRGSDSDSLSGFHWKSKPKDNCALPILKSVVLDGLSRIGNVQYQAKMQSPIRDYPSNTTFLRLERAQLSLCFYFPPGNAKKTIQFLLQNYQTQSPKWQHCGHDRAASKRWRRRRRRKPLTSKQQQGQFVVHVK